MGNVMQVTNMMEPSNNILDDNIDDEHDKQSKNDEYMSKSSDDIYAPGNKLTTDQEKLEYWMGFTSSW